MLNNNENKSSSWELNFSKFVLLIFTLFVTVIIVLCVKNTFVVKDAEVSYLENLEDAKLGKIMEIYPNTATDSKKDYFIINNENEAYLVILGHKNTDTTFTHESTLVDKRDLNLIEMLENSIEEFK